jgi:hypothetical protein
MAKKKIADKFVLAGETTQQHIMAGEPKNPGHCAEKLAVADAWNEAFGHFPKKVKVDRERIEVQDENKWWWGAPSEKQIHNLLALDNGQRYALTPHSWKVTMIKKCNVVKMSEATKRHLEKNYADKRTHPSSREPTVRRRVDGMTRMVPKNRHMLAR